MWDRYPLPPRILETTNSNKPYRKQFKNTPLSNLDPPHTHIAQMTHLPVIVALLSVSPRLFAVRKC